MGMDVDTAIRTINELNIDKLFKRCLFGYFLDLILTKKENPWIFLL